jgi:hypothetical protein
VPILLKNKTEKIGFAKAYAALKKANIAFVGNDGSAGPVNLLEANIDANKFRQHLAMQHCGIVDPHL